MLIDTHAHLYWESYQNDLDQVIQRSIEAGVTTIINVGVDLELSKKALQQVQGKPGSEAGLTAYSTIGIHPHEAVKYPDDVSIHKDISGLEQVYLSAPDQIVAVGECGLDYFFENNPYPTPLSGNLQKKLQRKLFQAQIGLAKKINLPLLVHCRDDRSEKTSNSECWNETLEMVGNHPTILHCYSGLKETTKKVLPSPNLLVSFAANITYPKNDYLREAAKILPLDRIVLETDSPFLAPQSKRGQRNEPASVKEIAQMIADLKGLTFKEVATQTTVNAKKILKLQ